MTRDDPYWPVLSELNGRLSKVEAEQMVLRPRLLRAEEVVQDTVRRTALSEMRHSDCEQEVVALRQTVTAIEERMEEFGRYTQRTPYDILRAWGPDFLWILSIGLMLVTAINPAIIKSIPPVSNLEAYFGD